MSTARKFSPFFRPILALCLFLTLWGAKLVAIDRFGSDLPYWDQWAKEGDYLFTPWFERHELWKNLVLPHNEHRIAPTLALNLALVVGGGQWDARVQCVASAALHAAIAVGLFFWALRRLPRRWALATGALIFLAIAPPIAWENALGGFQSGFYFLAGFSLLALGGLLTAPALSLRWWGGLACGLLALVSMGSGLLVAVPLLAVSLVRLFATDGQCRGAAITLAAGMLLGGLGAWLRTTAPWHDTLHVHNATEFITYAARCLAWPLPQFPWLALLLWLPWLKLLVLRLKDFRAAPHPSIAATDFALAGGAWVILQVAAVTFSRAGGGGFPASRYGDIAALGLVLSFIALALLSHRLGRTRATAAGTAWFAVAAVCVGLATRDAWAGPLASRKADTVAYEHNVQAFILTDDYATFAKQSLPFPLPEWLARILRRPDIRAILPVSVRAPLQLEGSAVPPAVTAGEGPAPPLPHRRTFTVATVGEWRSAPLTAPLGGWLKFETAGHVGEPGLALELHDARTGALLADVRPTKIPGNAWRAAYVPAPRGPFVVVARNGSTTQWLAFSAPVEMSNLSHAAWVLVKNCRLLAAGAAAACALLGLAALIIGRAPGPQRAASP